jgi:hypothetical protein
MEQSENAKKSYSEPELKAHGKISVLTQTPTNSSGVFLTFPTSFATTTVSAP